MADADESVADESGVRKGLSAEALEMIAERFKMFSEPMRLRLLYAMMDGEKKVSELVEATGGLQANVSKHLGMLLDAGIVARRKQGLNAYYSIADRTTYELCDLVCNSLEHRLSESLGRLTSTS
ncbi:MAG: metalloregulator ArsR/SmtB family transcription factor [Rubrobacter sp.]|nr:metalloregulator ArsR/SmtB family transcription factor [Rubrobacter sp.]